MTCYNCGESRHFVGTAASFFGSAGRDLGFYHIDSSELETMRWLNINNCGVVVIRKGKISMSELEKEPPEIFCKEWP
jgi:hypothetical protein